MEQTFILQLDSGRPPIDKLQGNIYKTIKNGNLDELRDLLSTSQEKIDLDCLDSSSKTALQVAADLEDSSVRERIITALLYNGASLQFGLLNAVRQKDVRVVEILLQFYDEQHQTSPRELLSERDKTAHKTPLILAACLQNFQIVKLLLEHGLTVDVPAAVRWSRDSTGAVSEKLAPAVYRLNKFRALASPVFIAASFLQNWQRGPDPVIQACTLSKQLRDMAQQEYEFRNEYLQLCDGCEEFTVSLLNECCPMGEIRCVLETKSERKMLSKLETDSLNMLEFAVFIKNKKFVSHPYSLLTLNSEIYKSAPFLEVESVWKELVLMLLVSVLYPLIFLVWFIFETCFPRNKLTRMFQSTRVKFLLYYASYQTFIFLLVFISTTRHLNSKGINHLEFWLLVSYVYSEAFVIGLTVDIIKDIVQQGRVRFFSYHWNYVAVATVVSYGLGSALGWTSLYFNLKELESQEDEDKHVARELEITSNSFKALAILLAFVHNLSFFQAHTSIGPLLNAFVQMLIDVAKFFLYFSFIFLAFAVSFSELYTLYEQKVFVPKPRQESNPLKLERLENSATFTFWALFGMSDRTKLKIKEEDYGAIWDMARALFGLFHIVAVLVGLNTLIAILSESYTRVKENLDTEWKFARTKMWLTWFYKKSVLPPPLSILYVVLPMGWVIRRLFKICCPETILNVLKKARPIGRINTKSDEIDEQQRREVIRLLVLRYLAKRSCPADSGSTLSGLRKTEREQDFDSCSQSNETVIMETHI